MRRIIGTIGATLTIAIVFGATMFDRTSLSDDAKNHGRIAGLDWEENWYEDYENGIFGTTMFDRTSPSDDARNYGRFAEFVPWAQSHDKFVALRSREGDDWFADGDWFEDQNEGDELDEDIADGSSAARLSAAITPTWRPMGTPNGGEVITLD